MTCKNININDFLDEFNICESEYLTLDDGTVRFRNRKDNELFLDWLTAEINSTKMTKTGRNQ